MDFPTIAHSCFGQSNALVRASGYWTNTSTACTGAICPDHLRLSHLGVADTWRGRVLRAVLWVLR